MYSHVVVGGLAVEGLKLTSSEFISFLPVVPCVQEDDFKSFHALLLQGSYCFAVTEGLWPMTTSNPHHKYFTSSTFSHNFSFQESGGVNGSQPQQPIRRINNPTTLWKSQFSSQRTWQTCHPQAFKRHRRKGRHPHFLYQESLWPLSRDIRQSKHNPAKTCAEQGK